MSFVIDLINKPLLTVFSQFHRHVKSYSLIRTCISKVVDIYLYNFRMSWNGDESNLIDRFDVRAHMDYIPELKPGSSL